MAVNRLGRLRQRRAFTSDLTVDEFAAIHAVGFEPLGQVMGSYVYRLGFTGLVYGSNDYGRLNYDRWAKELPELQSALRKARRTAHARLIEEAKLLGADGVVSVPERLFGEERTHEFTMVGTAVRARGGEPSGPPFTCALSGQDFASLIRSQHVPTAIAFGAAAAVDSAYNRQRGLFRAFANQELANSTGLAHQTRHWCRQEFQRSVESSCSEFAVSEAMELEIFDFEDANDNPRQGAVATLIGTGFASFKAIRGKDPPHMVFRLNKRPSDEDERNLMTNPPEQALDLPEAAMRRLHAPAKDQPRVFTSDLSVNEFLLLKHAGFRPLGMVLGTSMYHVGLQLTRWGANQELETLTQAMYHARHLAVSRMEAEAHALGADEIVGGRLTLHRREFGENIMEFYAVDTAVIAEGSRTETQWKTPAGRPFTSDLSGQDFWTLLQSGHAPLGLFMGSCVYHIAYRRVWQALGNLGRNTEVPQFTQALYEARELAMSRMQAEAEQLGAEGVVGVDLHSSNHVWSGHTTEFFCIGTAVRPFAVDHEITPPTMVIGLDS